ncbi:MAG: PilN domain-containing protein [Desulfuromonadaceae bacterium]|nr:PilN domain-containing protein [Desulfuromonadaceae bacterium]
MSKRRIGIERTSHVLRIAVVSTDQTASPVFELIEQRLDEKQGAQSVLKTALPGPSGFHDRFGLAIPGHRAYTRHLTFPFNEKQKIRAAAAMELMSQLPVDTRTSHVTITGPRSLGNAFQVTAACIESMEVAQQLQEFSTAKLPLHTLGLSPFMEVSGCAPWFANGLVALVHDEKLSLALVQNGEVLSAENAGLLEKSPEAVAEKILTIAQRLQCGARLPAQPLCLMGDGITDELREYLGRQQIECVSLPFKTAEQDVPAAFLPVCCRALAAGSDTLNFRCGPFAAKDEWSALKKHLLRGGLLLGLSLLVCLGSASLIYRTKTRLADTYQKQLVQIFRDNLPPGTAVVDIPLQMQAEVQKMREKARVLGLDTSTSALSILKEISSATPADLNLDIKTFDYEAQTLTLEGVTQSFDSVNRFANQLRQSPCFSQVHIAEANMGLDGQQVNFRLQLTM